RTMSEQNQVPEQAPKDGGEQATTTSKRTVLTPEQAQQNAAAKRAFASVEEAKASPPYSSNWNLYRVTRPDGSSVYSWEVGAAWAACSVARLDGYRGEAVEKAPRQPKQLTDEQLMEEIKRRGLSLAAEEKPAKGKKSKS